ncbi:hypothetical protein ACROYT_G013919 [Oculina patagonica]
MKATRKGTELKLETSVKTLVAMTSLGDEILFIADTGTKKLASALPGSTIQSASVLPSTTIPSAFVSPGLPTLSTSVLPNATTASAASVLPSVTTPSASVQPGVDLNAKDKVEMTGDDCGVVSFGQQEDLFETSAKQLRAQWLNEISSRKIIESGTAYLSEIVMKEVEEVDSDDGNDYGDLNEAEESEILRKLKLIKDKGKRLAKSEIELNGLYERRKSTERPSSVHPDIGEEIENIVREADVGADKNSHKGRRVLVSFYASREDDSVSSDPLHKEKSCVPLDEGRHKDLNAFKSHVISFTDIKSIVAQKGKTT